MHYSGYTEIRTYIPKSYDHMIKYTKKNGKKKEMTNVLDEFVLGTLHFSSLQNGRS